jgi:hypothetical protein
MKTSIEISRQATINAGSYNVIRPSISIRLDDIEMDGVIEKTELLQKLADNLFAKEVLALGDEINTILDIGFTAYKSALETKADLFDENIKKLYKKIGR